jgi:hypothetical protein
MGEKFRGIGVIFDTFKNSETLAFHKDITVVWNEGGTKIEEMLQVRSAWFELLSSQRGRVRGLHRAKP